MRFCSRTERLLLRRVLRRTALHTVFQRMNLTLRNLRREPWVRHVYHGGGRMKEKGVLKERRMKLWKKAAVLSTLVVGGVLMVPGSAFAAEGEGIPVDAAHFPDEAFRGVVSTSFDQNQDQVLDAEEIAQATYLYASNKGIKDVTGVKYFTSLHTLWLQDNELTTIDVSGMDTLYEFWCSRNSLKTLNVAGATNLNELSCYNNQLAKLDVSSCTNLTWLYCYGNKLTSLSLGGGVKLKYLNCSENLLQSIDVSKAVDLQNLRVQGNSFTTLNISASEYIQAMYQTGEMTTASGSSGTYYVYKNGFDQFSFDANVTIDLTVPVPADGWGTEDGHTVYIVDGQKVTGVQNIGEYTYYFDKNGYMRTGWVTKNGNRYYFDMEGRRVSGSKKIDGQWYYFSSKGAMRTGWITKGEKTYYFNADGTRAKGKLEIDGNTYYFASNGVMTIGWLVKSGKTYYFNTDGTMQFGWKKIGKSYYFFNSKGVMVTGWLQRKGNWYYLQDDGTMLANGTLNVGTQTYYFDKNGVCQNP